MSVPQAQIAASTEVSSFKMILVMGAVGTIASVLLVFTYQITLPHIEANRAAYLDQSVFQVLPGAEKKVTFVFGSDSILVPLESKEWKGQRFHAGYDNNGNLVGVAIEAQGQGFQDVISILYGYVPECECVVGMKVLGSKETPGLGDKIEKDEDFLSNFDSLDVSLDSLRNSIVHEIIMVKQGSPKEAWQIMAITGATVSSKAITAILGASTKQYVPWIIRNLETLRQGAQ